MRGIPIPWNVELIWSLETSGADQPGALWCGTIPGGLFLSKDCGQSWEFNWSLWNRPERKKWMGGGYDYPGIHSICVDPRDSRRRLFTVTDEGHALLRTGERVFDDLRAQWAERIGATELERLEEALSDLGIRIPTHFDAPGYLTNSPTE